MPVHSVLIVGRNSNKIIFSRYFERDLLGIPTKEAFEEKLRHHTSWFWAKLENEKNGETRHTVSLDSSIVLSFCMMGELVVYVNGTDDFDEETLQEPGNVINELIIRLLDLQGGANVKSANQCQEKHLLDEVNKDVYAKLALGIDEIIGSGVVENLDVSQVLNLIKLKSV